MKRNCLTSFALFDNCCFHKRDLNKNDHTECWNYDHNNQLQLTLGNSKSKGLGILLQEKRNSSNVNLLSLR
jgi:hypothetical protein